MTEKNNMEFWIFSLDDPELPQFCAAHADDNSFYHILCLQECTRRHSAMARQVLHLRNRALLLLDSYLMPLFCRLGLKGYVIVVTEAFCETDQTKAMLRYFFYHNSPEGINDLGSLNDDQLQCVELMYEEYHNPYDDQQPALLRNMMRNLPLMSAEANYALRLRSGHLLSHALQFMDLVSRYAPNEKRKAFYATTIGITEKALTHALKTIYGKTFREMLTFRILIEAMRLLVFSNESLSHIAQELNYDSSDFNKVFKKWKGMSPRNLRTSYREIIHQIENGY